jgi:Poly-beta-hydroxybutyrate polymerase N terminal
MSVHAPPVSANDLPQNGPRPGPLGLAQSAHLTGGLSMAAMRMAFDAWLVHLAHNPAQQAAQVQQAARIVQQLASCGASATGNPGARGVLPAVQDPLFAAPSWQAWPFNQFCQSFLLTQQWWQDASTGVRGVSPHHEDVARPGHARPRPGHGRLPAHGPDGRAQAGERPADRHRDHLCPDLGRAARWHRQTTRRAPPGTCVHQKQSTNHRTTP